MTTVAIVHYHLGQGGVSTVIAAASHCLTESGIRHVILAGSDADGLPVSVIPQLGYRPDHGGLVARDMVDLLRAAALDALGQPPGIWHFHNHSLGKNPLVPEIVALLAEENERLVLQIHDLAEDGRPANYQAITDRTKLYPVSQRIHYAFLNSRDRQALCAAGLPSARSCLLPNPVATPASPCPAVEGSSPILLAPVRGIRRKNLGELVFLSALAPAGTRFAISRAPVNHEALPTHEQWRKFSLRHRLPIGFDVVDRFSPAAGASADFQSWLSHATHFITTSVAEGFGLPFLEAAAHARPLLGRNLPHITAEHARHGIHAGNLYDRILIPVEWIDAAILRSYLDTTLERNHRAYSIPLTAATCEATFEALIHDGRVDFGNLPEPLQQGVIERLADPASREIPLVSQGAETRPAMDWLATAIANRTPTTTIHQLAPFSLAEYRHALCKLHAHLADQPASPIRFLPPSKILTAHLVPESFHFLLSAPEPHSPSPLPYRAVIFDIYGTLLIAPAGGVKPDPAADPMLRDVIRQFGHEPPPSPSSALHAAVRRHHHAAAVPFPEIDLRVLWREVLSLDPDTDTTPLVEAIESAWHPCQPMPGAAAFIQRLARSGVSLGLLSNAQCNTLGSLGDIKDLFPPELILLSYQHGIAKPSPALFEMLADRLEGRGISPAETLYIGNDPLQDIVPAAAAGFKTALFTAHAKPPAPGPCMPDHEFNHWPPSL